ncbi:MAG: PorT family protein [Ignavibacteria bacterium]|nr:PorT family protein [Ignavibacteria bacterium]
MKSKFLYLFIAAALLFSASNSMSQVSFAFGPEFGINLSNVSVNPTATTDSRTGFIIGGIADINIGKVMGVTSGLRYVMKGYTTSQGNTTFKVKLNYIEIPALLKARFPLTEVKPYLLGGPVLGINLAANQESNNGQQSSNTDVSNSIESIDFSLLFGGGLDFKIATKTSLFVQFGYQLGLSNVLKGQTTTTAKNYGIQITAGAKFNM